jgi:hypothetical protein
MQMMPRTSWTQRNELDVGAAPTRLWFIIKRHEGKAESPDQEKREKAAAKTDGRHSERSIQAQPMLI